MYYKLLTGKFVNKQAFCMEHGIAERSFDRDIEDVRVFLSEEQSYSELIYDRQKNVYYLSNVLGKSLSGDVSFLLVDILFYMKIFSKDEMEGILSEILDVTEIHKSNELHDYILKKAELKNSWGNKSIIKMHRDLERAIRNHNLIEINYEINEQDTVFRKVYPVQLKSDNGYIYLVAYIIDKAYKTPAFYRLDRIRYFNILNSQFSEDIQNQYFERTKHSDIYNMIAGDEVDIVVKVSKEMKRIIYDVFPNAVFIKNNGDGYVYSIKTYKQGFLSWIMGQEKGVVVLEPESIREEIVTRLKNTLKYYGEEMQ